MERSWIPMRAHDAFGRSGIAIYRIGAFGRDGFARLTMESPLHNLRWSFRIDRYDWALMQKRRLTKEQILEEAAAFARVVPNDGEIAAVAVRRREHLEAELAELEAVEARMAEETAGPVPWLRLVHVGEPGLAAVG